MKKKIVIIGLVAVGLFVSYLFILSIYYPKAVVDGGEAHGDCINRFTGNGFAC